LKFPDFIPNVGSWQKIRFVKQDGVSQTGFFQNFLETGNKPEFHKHDSDEFSRIFWKLETRRSFTVQKSSRKNRETHQNMKQPVVSRPCFTSRPGILTGKHALFSRVAAARPRSLSLAFASHLPRPCSAPSSSPLMPER
jgi:hypothetical protein